MYEVICPVCKEIRSVKAKKIWMIGNQPFEKECVRCCQKKPKTEEHKQKLKEAIKQLQTPEVLAKKRKLMLEHPEYWQPNLKQGGAEEHWLGKKHTEESKKKISEGVRNAKRRTK